MTPSNSPSRGGEAVFDQWQNARLQDLINRVTRALDKYDIISAGRKIEDFVTDFSTWYLRRNRGRDDKDFFATMYRSLIYLTKLLAPFMPFLADEIYQNLHAKGYVESVHLSAWPEAKKLTKEQEELLLQMSGVRQIVEQAHALRAKAGIKLRQPLAKLTITSPNPSSRGGEGEVAELFDILKDEVNVKEIEFGDKLEIDTNLTDDLKLEGLTAELTRQIQTLRKEQGLKIGEMVDLEFSTSSDILEKAMGKVDIRKTYLKAIHKTQSSDGAEISVDGNKILVKLT